MAAHTGYTHATTPGNLALGAGTIEYESAPDVWTKFGVTSGPPTFNRGEEFRTPDMDGVPTPIAGLDRLTFTEASIGFTIKETSAAKLALLRPGSTTVVAGGVTTISPPPVNEFIDAADLVGWRVSWKQRDGYHRAVFPKGFPTLGEQSAPDRAELALPVTIRSRLDLDAPGATIDDAPYLETFSAT